MISVDTKTDVKQEIKELVPVSYNFSQKYLENLKYKILLQNTKYFQNLKYNIKQACIFHLILVGIPSSLILSVTNRRWGEKVFT